MPNEHPHQWVPSNHLSALIGNWADVTFPFQKENPSSLEKHLPSTKNINKVTHVNSLLTTYTSLYVLPVRFCALCPSKISNKKKQTHPPQASPHACIAEPQSVGFCGDTLDLTTQPFLFPKKYLGSWGYLSIQLMATRHPGSTHQLIW